MGKQITCVGSTRVTLFWGYYCCFGLWILACFWEEMRRIYKAEKKGSEIKWTWKRVRRARSIPETGIVAVGDEWFKDGYRDCMHGQPRSRFSVLLHHLPCSFVILITSIESKNKRYSVPPTQIHYLTASYLSFLLPLTHSCKKDTLAEG